MSRTALVVGATGGVGRATAHALAAHGWAVVAMHRQPENAAAMCPELAVRWLTGNALVESDVVAAAAGVQLIVHAANPPGYKNWRELALPMLANTIAAAAAAGARIVLPGNVYNYGPDAGTVIVETAPQHPRSRKGQVRVEMETMLQAAAQERGVRSVVVRAGDFVGAHAPASWVETVMVTPKQPVRAVTYPGELAVGHAWAYLPDLAETIALIADREAELPPFDTFNFAGSFVAPSQTFVDALRRAAGVPNAPVKTLPWVLVRLLSPFVPLYREILEMRYLWQTELRLDNAKLVAFLGKPEPHTPLEDALTMTLVGLGCRPDLTPPSPAP